MGLIAHGADVHHPEWRRQGTRLRTLLTQLRPGASPDRLRAGAQPRNEQPPAFTAWTELDPEYAITIRGDLAWPLLRSPNVQRFSAERRLWAPTDTMLDTLLRHEVGHEVICPRNHRLAAVVRRGVRRGLAQSPSASRGTRLAMELWLANLVSDLVVNVTEAERAGGTTGYVEGLCLLWLDQAAAGTPRSRPGHGIRRLRPRWRRRAGLTPLMQAFVLAQTRVMPQAPVMAEALLGGHLRRGLWTRRRVRVAAQRVSEIILPASTRTDPSHWEDLAERVVVALAPLLPDQPPAQPASAPSPLFRRRSGQAGHGSPRPGAEGEPNGAGAEEAPAPSASPATPGAPLPGRAGTSDRSPRNGVEGHREATGHRAGRDDRTRNAEARSRNGSSTSVHGRRVSDAARSRTVGTGEGVATGIGLDGADPETEITPRELDAYYARVAGETALDFRSGPPSPPQLTTRVGPFRLAKEIGSLDPLDSVLICLDDSGSMLGGRASIEDWLRLPWGTNSPYHHALRAVYSLANWLQRAPSPRRFDLLTFSSTTRATGWHDVHRTRDVLIAAGVFRPQRGGTTIDTSVLSEHLGGDRHAVVVIVSDGQVSNCQEIGQLFGREDVGRRCVPALVEIRPGSDPSPLAVEFARRRFRATRLSHGADMPAVIGGIAAELLGR